MPCPISSLARMDDVLVLVGEPGTGRTFTARRIHRLSRYKGKDLRVVNVAVLPEREARLDLLGAVQPVVASTRCSLLEKETTLLIKHPDLLCRQMQDQLASSLSTMKVCRLGGTELRPVVARVIFLLNRTPGQLLRAGQLSPGLWECLRRGRMIRFQPLRRRNVNLSRLVSELTATWRHLQIGRVSFRAGEARFRAAGPLRTYSWPGNIAELKALIHASAGLDPAEALQAFERRELSRMLLMISEGSEFSLREGMRTIEHYLVERAFRGRRNNSAETARLLGLSERDLRRRLSHGQARSHTDHS